MLRNPVLKEQKQKWKLRVGEESSIEAETIVLFRMLPADDCVSSTQIHKLLFSLPGSVFREVQYAIGNTIVGCCKLDPNPQIVPELFLEAECGGIRKIAKRMLTYSESAGSIRLVQG